MPSRAHYFAKGQDPAELSQPDQHTHRILHRERFTDQRAMNPRNFGVLPKRNYVGSSSAGSVSYQSDSISHIGKLTPKGQNDHYSENAALERHEGIFDTDDEHADDTTTGCFSEITVDANAPKVVHNSDQNTAPTAFAHDHRRVAKPNNAGTLPYQTPRTSRGSMAANLASPFHEFAHNELRGENEIENTSYQPLRHEDETQLLEEIGGELELHMPHNNTISSWEGNITCHQPERDQQERSHLMANPNNAKFADVPSSPQLAKPGGDSIVPKQLPHAGSVEGPIRHDPFGNGASSHQGNRDRKLHLAEKTKAQASLRRTGVPEVTASGALPYKHVDEETDCRGHTETTNQALGKVEPPTLEHSVQKLSTMAYQDLEAESFDDQPRTHTNAMVPRLDSSESSDVIQQLFESTEPEHPANLVSMTSMPISQYDDLGNLLVERLRGITQHFEQARNERRKIVEHMELGIAKQAHNRSHLVQGVDRELRRLKKAGKDVVMGKP